MRILMSLIAALLLAASATAAPAETKFTFGYTPVSETVSAYAAKSEGVFTAHGLNVTMLPLSSSAVLATSLIAGSVDVASITPAVFLQAVDGGLDLVVLTGAAASTKTARVSAVVVPPNSPIKSAKDFIGKRVAVAAIHSALDIQFHWWLASENVDAKKVRFVEAAYANQADLLRSGAVDAVVTSEPFLTRLLNAKLGTAVTYLSDRLPEGTSMVVYVATRAWANAHADAIKAFRQSIIEGIKVSADNAKAEKYIGEYLKLPPEMIKYSTHSKLDEKISPAQLQWWVDAMKAQGLLRSKINTAALIMR